MCLGDQKIFVNIPSFQRGRFGANHGFDIQGNENIMHSSRMGSSRHKGNSSFFFEFLITKGFRDVILYANVMRNHFGPHKASIFKSYSSSDHKYSQTSGYI